MIKRFSLERMKFTLPHLLGNCIIKAYNMWEWEEGSRPVKFLSGLSSLEKGMIWLIIGYCWWRKRMIKEAKCFSLCQKVKKTNTLQLELCFFTQDCLKLIILYVKCKPSPGWEGKGYFVFRETYQGKQEIFLLKKTPMCSSCVRERDIWPIHLNLSGYLEEISLSLAGHQQWQIAINRINVQQVYLFKNCVFETGLTSRQVFLAGGTRH